ncbi:hypothetical protein SKAU_G00411830 [Synaphobranchus kaupii]|uniref:HTH CENPB-type domain-containing protein n=1 Tax=Synaphobranchus kaupii TaxID=118154 RepID=A0A9Q1E7Z9_SYNKA|nr:hypothetical protein SKAU_G00411830 [Synaphobranchus kaupii]
MSVTNRQARKWRDEDMVPRSTLADRVSGRVTHGAVSGPGQLLSKPDELSLVRYCQYMASHGHPLTKSQCSAFGTSIRRERDPNAQPLSRTWWRNFRQRHHVDLTLRTPEIIDRAARTSGARHGGMWWRGSGSAAFSLITLRPSTPPAYYQQGARKTLLEKRTPPPSPSQSHQDLLPPPPSTSSVPPPPVPPRPRIHPLVASGDISADLAEILMECDYKKKTTRRLPVAARVITGEEFQQLFREREEKEQAAAALKEQRAQLRRTKMLGQSQRAAVAAASSFTAAGSGTTSGTVARPPRSRGTPAAPSRRRGPAAPLRTSTSPDQHLVPISGPVIVSPSAPSSSPGHMCSLKCRVRRPSTRLPASIYALLPAAKAWRTTASPSTASPLSAPPPSTAPPLYTTPAEAHLMPSSSGEPALARPMTPPSGNYDLD